jgi:hypothetical protein
MRRPAAERSEKWRKDRLRERAMKAERRIGIVIVIQRLRSAVRRLQAELPIVAQRSPACSQSPHRKITKVDGFDAARITASGNRAS